MKLYCIGIGPVSYTQLDVYKRQGLTTLGANTFSMAIAGPFVSYGIYKLCHKPVSYTHLDVYKRQRSS